MATNTIKFLVIIILGITSIMLLLAEVDSLSALALTKLIGFVLGWICIKLECRWKTLGE